MDNNEDQYIMELIADDAEDRRALLTKCNTTIVDHAARFVQPISVLVTVTCDGRLAFYMERGEGEDQFIARALEQGVAAGVHLLGYFSAEITMDEAGFTAFTRADHDAAIDRYVTMREEEVQRMNDALEQMLAGNPDE